MNWFTESWMNWVARPKNLNFRQAISQNTDFLTSLIYCNNNILHNCLTFSVSITYEHNFTTYLHLVEDAWFLKVELNVHTALPEGFPAPTQVVVPRPHPVLFSLYEVISSQDAITQLTQASKLHSAHTPVHVLMCSSVQK